MAKVGTLGSASLYRVGVEVEGGGAGIKWIHACGPEGFPSGAGYPCNHLNGFFAAARAGHVAHGLRLTAEGEEMAQACGCIRSAREAAPEAFEGVPLIPEAEPEAPRGDRAPKGAQGGSQPCACGSGRKYRRCHGAPGGPAPGAPAYPATEEAKAQPSKEAIRAEAIRKAERAAARLERLEARLARPELAEALARAEERKKLEQKRNRRRAELRRRTRGM